MKILALAGGVGGAKFAYGLYHSLNPVDLAVVVNTGDDFIHYGLSISPDLDTVCYTLADLENLTDGWGLSGDSWNVLESLKRIGAPAWFKLGDKDLATHLERTRRILAGESLSKITRDFCKQWGITTRIIPMTDQCVQTMVITKEYGEIPFQEYFVKHQFKPVTCGFRFEGLESSHPHPDFIQALEKSDCVVICPSNPWLSILPILSLPSVMETLTGKPVVAISPIIGGKALKGPAGKIFMEMGMESSVFSIMKFYENILNGFVIDHQDREKKNEIDDMGIITLITNIVMKTKEDRIHLAKEVIDFCKLLVNG